MESRYWGVLRKRSQAVTITDGSQTLYFNTKGECAKFLEPIVNLKAVSIYHLLTRRVDKIADWKIVYEGKRE